MNAWRALPFPLRVIALTALYLAVVVLGLQLQAQPENTGILWPASGIFLAVLLLTSRREWPVYVSSFVLASAVADVLVGRNFLLSTGYAVIDGLEALIAAALFTRIAGQRITFGTLRETLTFCLLAGTIAAALSALLAALLTVASGSKASIGGLWFVWFASVLIGILAVTPVLVTWAQVLRDQRRIDTSRLPEACVLYSALTITTLLLFAIPS